MRLPNTVVLKWAFCKQRQFDEVTGEGESQAHQHCWRFAPFAPFSR